MFNQNSVQVFEPVQLFVIDNGIDERIRLKEMLLHENYIAHTAAGIKDTLVKLTKMDHTQKFLFLTDWKLDDCYAPELAVELCRHNIDGTFIMLTNGFNPAVFEYMNTNYNTRKDCKLFIDYLFKPVCFEKLMQMIKKHLS